MKPYSVNRQGVISKHCYSWQLDRHTVAIGMIDIDKLGRHET